MANKSAYFDSASSQTLSVANSAPLNLASDSFTIEAWVKSDLSKYTNIIVAKDDETDGRNYALYLYGAGSGNDGKFGIQMNGNGGNQYTSAIPANEWHHIAVTSNGTTVQFYIDGVASGTATYYASAAGTGPTTIGGRSYSGAEDYADGTYISNVRLWNVVRTAAQIRDYSGEILTTGTGLVASWALANLNDSGPNGLTLTNNNSTEFSADGPVLAKVLVVAGGGGGGAGGGGGGAGGLKYRSGIQIENGTYGVIVGTGGAGGVDYLTDGIGTDGGDSTWDTSGIALTSNGGGGGGGYFLARGAGRDGGSGGGGGGFSGAGAISGGTATPAGEGNNGGAKGGMANNYPGGGGGGAGAAGVTPADGNAHGGNGGDGLQYSIDGTNRYYAGGGGGGELTTNPAGAGGQGGGGAGGGGAGNAGVAGTDGFGGGGGGSNNTDAMNAPDGGDGCVIIAYTTSEFSHSYSGTSTTGTNGTETWVKMTTSGNLTLSGASTGNFFMLF